MTSAELTEIVAQRMSDPSVVGRLACNLRSALVEQLHHDDRQLAVSWEDCGDYWRCTITSRDNAEQRVAQIDVHEHGTIRVDAFEPCRVTVSPEESLLCLTRYR